MSNEEKILQILTQIQTDMNAMKGDINGLKQGQANLEQGQANLEQGQANLKQGQANLKQEVDALKRITLRMEQENEQNFKALFDGYSSLYDISKEIRKDVSALLNDTEKHELHIKRLNAKMNL